MNKNDTILIAGPKGLVGSALVRRLEKDGYTHLLTPAGISLFGFSRGAFTVCCLAGMLHKCGLLEKSSDNGDQLTLDISYCSV